MRLFIAFAAAVCLACLTGCGVTQSRHEIANTVAQSIDLDARQLVDDWNTVWLVDRQYRLTRWYTR